MNRMCNLKSLVLSLLICSSGLLADHSYKLYRLKDGSGNKVCMSTGAVAGRVIKRSLLECSLLCQNTATCSGYNYYKNSRFCEINLSTAVSHTSNVNCLSFRRLCNDKDGADQVTDCSFPSTLDKQLHKSCFHDSLDICRKVCLDQERAILQCQSPSDFVAVDGTKLVSISKATTPLLSVNDWIILQDRLDPGNQNFKLAYQAYVDGFKTSNGGFWLGLERWYQLANGGKYKLRFEFQLSDSSWFSAEYYNSFLGDETSKYKLNVGRYVGDAGDAIRYKDIVTYSLQGRPFYSYDDVPSKCAPYFTGGWWMSGCYACNLNNIASAIEWDADIQGRNIKVMGSRMMTKAF